MNAYLKYINPIVAIVILLICIWSALYDGTKQTPQFSLSNAWSGGIPNYFIAKGIFCSSAIFLLGKILETIRNK